MWDARSLRVLADRQVEPARSGGLVTVLPIALSLLRPAQTVDGGLDVARGRENRDAGARAAALGCAHGTGAVVPVVRGSENHRA